jgi:solute carrier family 25 uncoupling protein 8/9
LRCIHPAQIATLPIDTAKVRLQLLQKLRQQAPASPAAASQAAAVAAPPAAAQQRLGMISVMKVIAREEGAAALYKGLWPAVHRQLVFASLRIGLYKQVSGSLDPDCQWHWCADMI